jgi:hypothetical protein
MALAIRTRRAGYAGMEARRAARGRADWTGDGLHSVLQSRTNPGNPFIL